MRKKTFGISEASRPETQPAPFIARAWKNAAAPRFWSASSETRWAQLASLKRRPRIA